MKYLAGDICQIREVNKTGYKKTVAFMIVELTTTPGAGKHGENPKFIYECWVVTPKAHFTSSHTIDVFYEDLIPVLLVPR